MLSGYLRFIRACSNIFFIYSEKVQIFVASPGDDQEISLLTLSNSLQLSPYILFALGISIQNILCPYIRVRLYIYIYIYIYSFFTFFSENLNDFEGISHTSTVGK
jgi:hypothetical protein